MDDLTTFDMSLWKNGPAPGSFHNFPGKSSTSQEPGRQLTLNPSTSGTSVIGVRFNGGVMVAADTLGSYGSMAMFRDLDRVMTVNNTTVLAASGDYADFQYMKQLINEKVNEDDCLNDGFQLSPRALYSWVTRIMYYRRCKFNPLWSKLVIAGLNDGKPFLGQVDMIGVAFEAPCVASGYGAYIALPLLRDAVETNPNMSEQEARALLDKCLRVLYYRDARSFNRYKIAVVTSEGSKVEGPFHSQTDWSIANMVKGF